jgi:hypothetical protein
MSSPLDRREFLSRSVQVGALAGLGNLAFLDGLPPLSAAQVEVRPTMVQFSDDIEPLVRLIEETPRRRNRLFEAVGQKIRTGTSYQQLLSALMLAGVRGIKPRPVGFQFHAVLVVNSAHLATLAAADRDRWLPLFWALDNFKASQVRNAQQNPGWVMAPVNEATVPGATQARQRFITAMDDWDIAGADQAVAGLVRTAGAGEVIELFWRYGARDFRDIGHKAIYVANAWRTLHTIGWRHAEPIMRSLTFALLDHEGGNPAQRDADPDRPWRQNLQRVMRIRNNWQRGQVSPQAATDLLAALRTGSVNDACERVVTMLNSGVDPQSLWDGLFLTAGELLMRQPGIVGVHCVTSVNALHFGYCASENDETRQLLLLQTAAFLVMFRLAMLSRGQLRDLRLDTLQRIEPQANTPAGAVEEVFSEISRDRIVAAQKTLGALHNHPTLAQGLIAAGRRLVFTKGRDSHDYKFSSAALEDYFHATPALRDRYLATSMFFLRGSGDQDTMLLERTQAALGS